MFQLTTKLTKTTKKTDRKKSEKELNKERLNYSYSLTSSISIVYLFYFIIARLYTERDVYYYSLVLK